MSFLDVRWCLVSSFERVLCCADWCFPRQKWWFLHFGRLWRRTNLASCPRPSMSLERWSFSECYGISTEDISIDSSTHSTCLRDSWLQKQSRIHGKRLGQGLRMAISSLSNPSLLQKHENRDIAKLISVRIYLSCLQISINQSIRTWK